jgi:hypothetical protein
VEQDLPRYFITPSGQRWLLARSITRDNWLTWRHALPEVATECSTVRYRRLDQEVCRNITKLAANLQALLMAVGPRSLEDCPWTVHRWWRHRDGAPFSAGGACEFSVNGLDRQLLIDHAGEHSLRIEPLFGPLMLAELKGRVHSSRSRSSSSPTRS